MFWRRQFQLDGNQEREAIDHFPKIIKPWRERFTEDNWPTTAGHLHELLHRALIEEGANPQWIAFLARSDWELPTDQ
ncbi:MAG: hypothetical protein BroJett013_06750 [Alphaproteobacteria bacterium]|nr:MAG: hypothetical protein BroJett013_06750 [Alphaproteobacteria bacterium]